MPPTPKRICFFASYFANGHIPEYIKGYLLEIKKYCHTLVFISHNKVLAQNEANFLTNNQIMLDIKPNYGHDFGSWMYALAVHETKDFDEVLFVNDSCLLVQPLNNFFGWLRNAKLDFAGMINSNERKYHLQSYFFVANQAAVQVIKKQFNKYGIITDKNKLIKYYEIGITQAIIKARLKIGSFIQTPSANLQNPLFHQTLLLLRTNFPLVKKQLVFNSLSISDLETMQSAGIYVGPQIIKATIEENSGLRGLNWNVIYDDIPHIN